MARETGDPGSPDQGISPDERNLVVRAQSGDMIAFEVLYERYNDRICRYLTRMIGNDGIGCELPRRSF